MLRTKSTSTLAAFIFILVSLALPFTGITAGRGQQETSKASSGSTSTKTKLYFGVSECTGCHSDPDKYKDAPPILCTCDEATIWKNQDKHKDAYVNLFNEGGRQIATLLKYTTSAIENKCLPCHGVRVEDKKLLQPTFKLEEGVSCVVCHGPYLEWVEQHGGPRRFAWREKTRAEKEEKFGMTDLWDAAKRARKCASCHVGDQSEGKVVTHEMYAAGHPPLPGLESATFSDQMPKHWKYLFQKSPKAQEILHYHPAVLERTQLVVIAGIAELEQSMQLLASQAEAAAHAGASDNRTLDLAAFDCYACHHDLKTPSWRQARGYAGKPGRPQFRPWPTALVRLGIFHAGPEAERAHYQQLEKSLRAAFDAQPFGDAVRVAEAARALQKWCQDLEARLTRSPESFNQAAARGLLQEICTLAAGETLDYDSARQFAWAFRVIYHDLKPAPANDPEIQKQLALLDQALKLRLPSGQNQKIAVQLSDTLNRIASYDPDRTKGVFRELSKLLTKR